MKKIIEYINYTVGVLYFPCLALTTVLSDQSGSFLVFPFSLLFLILFLLSFHYLCIFLELGFVVLRLFEKKERTKGEKILNIATFVCFAGLIITTIFEPELGYAKTIIYSLLVPMWILGDIIFKQKKFTPEVFKKKSFWVSCTAILVTICLILSLSTGKLYNKAQPDPIETSIEETHHS